MTVEAKAASAGTGILLVEDAPMERAHVRLLTLNRPERRNALSPELVVALTDAVVAAGREHDVRAIVITGAGDKAFCAGGDLGAPSGEGFLAMHEDRGAFVALLSALRFSTKPIIAAVNGIALGGGFGIVLGCDLAVAAVDAELGTPEVKRGLFPMMIARLIYETLPRRSANELVLMGEKVSGARAVDLGIVNRVVDKADVLTVALELATTIASLSPAALSLGRRAMMRQLDMPFDVALPYLRDQLTLNLQTEDAAEGVSAFFEKREPRFTGR